jgi:hypothetical protein
MPISGGMETAFALQMHVKSMSVLVPRWKLPAHCPPGRVEEPRAEIPHEGGAGRVQATGACHAGRLLLNNVYFRMSLGREPLERRVPSSVDLSEEDRGRASLSGFSRRATSA